MGNNNEEMRKMLKEMSDYPNDVFDYGCASFGEAAAWALKTIDAQQAEIERLKEENKRLKKENKEIQKSADEMCFQLYG